LRIPHSAIRKPIRVPAEIGIEGLDIPEVGTPAYPDYVLHADGRSRGPVWLEFRLESPSIRGESQRARDTFLSRTAGGRGLR